MSKRTHDEEAVTEAVTEAPEEPRTRLCTVCVPDGYKSLRVRSEPPEGADILRESIPDGEMVECRGYHGDFTELAEGGFVVSVYLVDSER